MKTRPSEVDKNFKITEEKWVLIMARKVHGSHSEHTFLILEGIEHEQAVIWLMDFVGNPILPNIKTGKVRVKHFTANEDELSNYPLIFRCNKHYKRENYRTVYGEGQYTEMLDLDSNENIACQKWFIDKDKARQLIINIEADKLNPPIFNILGKQSVFTASSAYASSKERGHNCFTYAKEKIGILNDPTITVTNNTLSDWVDNIACIASLKLKNSYESTFSFWKKATVATLAAGVVVVGYYYSSY